LRHSNRHDGGGKERITQKGGEPKGGGWDDEFGQKKGTDRGGGYELFGEALDGGPR